MKGPYDLKEEIIDLHIEPEKIGNYALGWVKDKNTFIINYVGRSDTDLNKRLQDHIGEASAFMFSYESSPKEAYKKECQNWHDFDGPKGKLRNKIHPDKPEGKENCHCPVCKE